MNDRIGNRTPQWHLVFMGKSLRSVEKLLSNTAGLPRSTFFSTLLEWLKRLAVGVLWLESRFLDSRYQHSLILIFYFSLECIKQWIGLSLELWISNCSYFRYCICWRIVSSFVQAEYKGKSEKQKYSICKILHVVHRTLTSKPKQNVPSIL